MIRYGDKIRLTAKDQKMWSPFNNGKPLNIRTVKQFNDFIEAQIAARYPGNSNDEEFFKLTMRHYKIPD